MTKLILKETRNIFAKKSLNKSNQSLPNSMKKLKQLKTMIKKDFYFHCWRKKFLRQFYFSAKKMIFFFKDTLRNINVTRILFNRLFEVVKLIASADYKKFSLSQRRSPFALLRYTKVDKNKFSQICQLNNNQQRITNLL